MKVLKLFTVAAMLAALSLPASAQVFEGGSFCDICDDASPSFVLSLYAPGTYGEVEPSSYPCPSAGFAQFSNLVDDGVGNFSGSGHFALYDAASPCRTDETHPAIFSLHCSDAQIVAHRIVSPGFAGCSFPTVWAPITQYWNDAVVTGIDDVSGARFEARMAPGAFRFITNNTCPMWVATLSVSVGVPSLHIVPPLVPSTEPLKPGKGKGRSFGAFKAAFRK